MRKYFCSDGIRRIANTELSPELVYKVAKAGAYVLSKHSDHTPTILIGKDTRISGSLIESAMVTGFLSYGANVKLLGVMPTPAVAFLTREMEADASVVISASHNTFEFNGIKFFSNKGMKIPDEIEEEIEEVMDSGKLDELSAVGDKIGVSEIRTDLIQKYVEFFKELFTESIDKYNYDKFEVVIDTANGATYQVAEEVFKALGIRYHIINNKPNGININDNCGSTHLEALRDYVLSHRFQLGIAYDGDGDRCLAIDELGNIIDGDNLLAIISNYLDKKSMLKKKTVVATVMSNLGLNKYCKRKGTKLVQTKVGDRYVLEEMLKSGYNLGGEQSGHVILLDYNPTGDGILTSLMLIQAILESGKTASELSSELNTYPQVLMNAKVSESKKYDYESNEEIKTAIEQLEKEFSGNGRVLIRPSGTEPLVRVMIEGEDQNYIEEKAIEIANLIEEKLK